ncbi:hypothetical protein HYC85_010566 [Camellia sinensis]|uniref:Myb/SANT-like domain-containing protein n=1 Tax=Camellia sinensis TaxID=4442 RepID=A0A7J7HI81_CAMSI|nr:hypothetical protein HYC85_010566 [Camellia sinensis]
MASNKGFDTRRDLIEAYVALQHIVSSMNYTCGVYLVILHAALERTKGVSDSKHVVLEEKVAMFLSVLGHHHKNRTVKFNFMRSGETAVLQLQGVLLKTPEPIIAGCTDDRWRWFQNCLGALDGTYVRVLPPAIDKPRYRSRKGEIATNVLGVCSQDMQFIYVLPGWEGSASDSRVLRDAISRPNGLRVPTGMDDSTATSSCGRKGKGKTTSSSSRGRRVWTPKECDVLIRAMRDLFSEKWKADNGQFRAGLYSELEKLIILAFPGTDLRASPHIESKIKFWKRQYNLITDMLRLSGFGWDDTNKMILVDSEQVWQNYVKKEPDAKGMRNVPFPYYEDWLILFGKDRATGALAESPADMVAALEKEDQTTDECYTPMMDLSGVNNMNCSLSANGTPTNQSTSATTSKKRARESESIAKGLAEMATQFGSFFEKTNTTMAEIAHRIGYAHDISEARKLVNGELSKLPLNSNDRLRAATLIVKDAERVDLFFSLPEEEKMEWVCLL